ncbi:metallophosphoesterase family protein [Neobacillus sp. NPDC097160]|uniref:metallophosphoesterase family protein n=1 Tax=Neobacillus sp. NPDC097160 TaxID=3364298 RepID=UPI00381D35E8
MKKIIVSILLVIAILSFPIFQLKQANTQALFQSATAQNKSAAQIEKAATHSRNAVQESADESAKLQQTTDQSATQLETENKPAFQLAVISDTHIDTHMPEVTTKFETALKDLKNIAPEYDAIAVNGDMTNFGLVGEYEIFKSILNANKNPNADKFMVMGNHEWLEKRIIPDTAVTDDELKNRFIDEMGVPGLYYDKWIKGYHFITIAGEKSESTMKAAYGESGRDSAYISDDQYQWLENTLSINAEDNKPIFVFFHQPIKNTVYGSEWGAGLDDQKILALLKKYPQVILFSGHSHYPLDNPKSIYTDGIMMVNTSSVAYTYTPEGGDNYTLSQGYMVNVYDDKVEFKAREFSTGTWIKTVTITIMEPNQQK